MTGIALVDGVQDFVRFLDQIGLQRGAGLFAVPGAPALAAQPGHQRQESIEAGTGGHCHEESRGLRAHYTQGRVLLEGLPCACYAPSRAFGANTMADEETFKVTDRRGHARDVSASEPATSPPASATTAPRPGPEEPVSTRPRPSERASDRGAPDLQGLFVMFASSALIHLGEAPDPTTSGRQVDLDQAKEAIDLLLLLRDKTTGNRTDDESRLLEHLIYD